MTSCEVKSSLLPSEKFKFAPLFILPLYCLIVRFLAFQVQNLFDVTVSKNKLYVTSPKNHSVFIINKYAANDFETLTINSKPFSIHVYHRQRLPVGK